MRWPGNLGTGKESDPPFPIYSWLSPTEFYVLRGLIVIKGRRKKPEKRGKALDRLLLVLVST
jgi:hypothetical protein